MPAQEGSLEMANHCHLFITLNHDCAVLASVDRKSRYNKFRKLNGKHAKKVTKETIIALKALPKKSMTNEPHPGKSRSDSVKIL